MVRESNLLDDCDAIKLPRARLAYVLHEHVLDAADFDVPRRRRRLFIAGARERHPGRHVRKRPGRKKSETRGVRCWQGGTSYDVSGELLDVRTGASREAVAR